MQTYVIKFVSEYQKVGGGFAMVFSLTHQTGHHGITEILLIVALNANN
jgi:hypothetical protein